MAISYIPINPIQLPQFPQQPNIGEQLLRLSQMWQEADLQRDEAKLRRMGIQQKMADEKAAGQLARDIMQRYGAGGTTGPIVDSSAAPSIAELSGAAPSVSGGASLAAPLTKPANPPATTPDGRLTVTHSGPEYDALQAAIRTGNPRMILKAHEEWTESARKRREEGVGAAGNALQNKVLRYMPPEAFHRAFGRQLNLTLDDVKQMKRDLEEVDKRDRENVKGTEMVRLATLEGLQKQYLDAGDTVGAQRLQAPIDALRAAITSKEQAWGTREGVRAGFRSEAQKRMFEHQDAMQARSLAAAEIRSQAAAAQQAAVAARTNDNQLRSLANQRINSNTANPLAKKIMDKQDRLSVLDTDIQLAMEASKTDKDVSLSHLTVLYDFVSGLDNSVVRDSERQTFAKERLGYLAYIDRLRTRLAKGEIFSPADFQGLQARTAKIRAMVASKAQSLADEMVAESVGLGIPPELAIETVPWTMLGAQRPTGISLGGRLSPKQPMGLEPPPTMAPPPPPAPTMGAKGGVQTQSFYTDGTRAPVPITASDSIPADNGDIEDWIKGMTGE